LGRPGLSVGLFQCGVGGHGYRLVRLWALTLVEELGRHHGVVVTALDPAHRSLQQQTLCLKAVRFQRFSVVRLLDGLSVVAQINRIAATATGRLAHVLGPQRDCLQRCVWI